MRRAIQSFGRADGNKDAIKSHIVKRARVIGGEIVVPRSGMPSHGVIQASLAGGADRCVTAAPSVLSCWLTTKVAGWS